MISLHLNVELKVICEDRGTLEHRQVRNYQPCEIGDRRKLQNAFAQYIKEVLPTTPHEGLSTALLR